MSDKHKDAQGDTGAQAIFPPEFPKFMPDFCKDMSAEEIWEYGCLTGWRAGHFDDAALARRASQVSAAAPADSIGNDPQFDYLHVLCETSDYSEQKRERRQRFVDYIDNFRASEGQAQTSGPEVVTAASALLDCLDGLPVDTDEATAAALTAFDRTRSRLKKAIAGQAQTSAVAFDRKEFIRQVVLAVCEIPDRDSPEDQPEIMLVTDYELTGILESCFENADERAAQLADSTGGVKS